MKKILFVCTGNICRSSAADAVLRNLLKGKDFHVDSAALGHWHEGNHADPRTIKAASSLGFHEIHHVVSRQIRPQDFYDFDLFIAMDHTHLEYLQQYKPEDFKGEIALFFDFVMGREGSSVADPYYGDDHGFELMMEDIIKGCQEIKKYLLAHD